MPEFVDKDKLEAEFAEAMAPVEHGNRLLMIGLNLEDGGAEVDAFTVTDAATPSETKTVMVATHTESGKEYKITVEELITNG